MGRENSFIITKKLNEKLKEKFNFADKRYSLEARYNSYEEEIAVDLMFYEGDYSENEIDSLLIGSSLYFHINPKEYNNIDIIIENILIKSKEHINNNFMDNKTRYEIIENVNKIMEKYNKKELVNEYDEIEVFDYSLYILECGVQCGGGYDSNFAFNVYKDEIYNLNTEECIKYKNYEELINIIKEMVDVYTSNLEEEIRNSNEEREDYYDESNYTRPQDYPDWDGDESIMYELDL